jgi:quercetin dioxygenase-like cupin family protein
VKVARGRADGVASEQRRDTFTGIVWSDPILRSPGRINIGKVFFAPQARTFWHRHSEGQILYVNAGEGYVVTRSGEACVVTPGDVVFADPGEEHWHGAREESLLLHLAISLGTTEWLEPVSDDDYARSQA